MRKPIVFTLLFTFAISLLYAGGDEGMWLPLYIKKLNEKKMQEYGYKLSAEDIYNINNASLKDAVLRLGEGFCTGELVSAKGLIFTNHHCGYDAIASLSTVENDFITNGYWAKTMDQEIPVPGLTVSRLVYMQDITAIIESETKNLEEGQADERKTAIIDSIQAAAVLDNHYDAEVKSFFGNTEYYLLVYETFKDVRFVGAPPSSIGKFGGDTDNWMWPRHTGDFSILRVYVGQDGKPAEYSTENIPYKPMKFFPISLKGVQENDFSMILGYPGTTERYLSSYDIQFKQDKEQPALIDIFGDILSEMKVVMDKDDHSRIEMASEYASMANTWKYFEGQNLGLKNYGLVGKYQDKEKSITNWINEDSKRVEKYGKVLPDLKTAYVRFNRIMPGLYYLAAGLLRIDAIGLAASFSKINDKLASGTKQEEIQSDINELKIQTDKYYDLKQNEIDKKLLPSMLMSFYNSLENPFEFPLFKDINDNYKGEDFNAKMDAYLKVFFANSIIFDKEKLEKFYAKPSKRSLKKEMSFNLYESAVGYYRDNYMMTYMSVTNLIGGLQDKYIELLKDYRSNEALYPDANSTLRMTYGQVLPYHPRDAVYYNFHTTQFGILDKEDPKNEEFNVDPKLKALLEKKDFGQYGVGDTLYTCFLTNNDITGGNSGSPVINGNGELIGIAFDGNWEAMTGDLVVNPKYNRTINVDIRYVLFVIDKFAGATNLIEELNLVK